MSVLQRLAGSVLITSPMVEDRAPLWPGKPGARDPYPWRLETEPEIVLDEDEWVPAAELKDDLEHVRKWPPDHWKLAFQGQLRPVSATDAAVVESAVRDAVQHQPA